MKKYAIVLSILLLSCGYCFSAEVRSVRYSTSSEKVRIVIDISEPVNYNIAKQSTGFVVSLPGTTIKKEFENYKVYDGMLKDFSFEKEGNDLNLFIETSYPIQENIFTLKEPPRIVIDLPRIEENTSISAETEDLSTQEMEMTESTPSPQGLNSWFTKSEPVIDGVCLLRINQEINNKPVRSYALLVDPRVVDISPVICVPEIKGKEGGSIFGALFNWFKGGQKKDEAYSHFSKKTVSSFVKMMGAVAGVNGSFFYGSGTPVGTLIVNRQVISSPLYNRTALIINNNGTASIDQVRMEGYLKLQNDETLGFSGVNQPIKKDEIIVYTPDYQSTDPSGSSSNIVVIDGKVTQINFGETKIPKNGFVICANGPAGEALKDRFKKGDEVKWFFMASPPLDSMLHVIAAGPRLVYKGQLYVSSQEEKFRRDVANSRAARTAVGITNNGSMLFVVIEKNGESAGGTLEDLGNLMIKLGASDAMNLDGGGSSTMVVNGQTLNAGAERPVSNAIVIKPK